MSASKTTATSTTTATRATTRLSIPSLHPHVCFVMFQRMNPGGQQRSGAPRGGEGSGGCVLSGVTSSRPSQWHWRQPLTTALNKVGGPTCAKPHGDTETQRTASAEATYDAPRNQVRGTTRETRPDRLYEVRPQDRVQRRTVEQNVNTLFVPTIDVPVPQMENQLVEVCRLLDFLISRAGYRSAQDLLFLSFSQPCAFRGADGGTVGGSAYDRFFFLRCTGLWS